MKILKSISIYCTLAVFALGSVQLSAQSVTTTPVGYVKLTIKGTGGQGSEAFSYLGVPMHHAADFQNVITATADNSITCANAGWTLNEYENSHYIMILSGTNTGMSTTITGNTGDTLTTADNLSQVLTGDEQFAIHKYTTIADVFGATNSAGLKEGSFGGGADNILIQGQSNNFNTYYYSSGGLFGGEGWRSVSSPTNDASETIIPHGAGIVVVRRDSSDITITVLGSVFPKDVTTPVEEGYNWKTSSIPIDLTLSKLFGMNNETNLLKGGSFAGDADKVLVFDDDGTYSTYYFKNGGLFGGTGWRSVRSNDVDESNAIIAKPGKMFMINRSNGIAFNLTEKSPL